VGIDPRCTLDGSPAQELGVHVHLGKDGARIVDDTFGTVICKGTESDRAELLENMVKRTIV
jgi:hypothetical protein